MRAATAAGALLLALVALGGCGSSHATSSSSTGGTSTGGGASGGGEGSTGAAGVRVNTTPKFISPPAGAPVRTGVVQIAMRNITLSPDAIRVKVGSSVRWTNYDNVEHNLTSVSGPQRLSSGNFGKGGTYAVRLRRPGVIHYLCTDHPATMNGTIEVVG
jgi:plastocyanin